MIIRFDKDELEALIKDARETAKMIRTHGASSMEASRLERMAKAMNNYRQMLQDWDDSE